MTWVGVGTAAVGAIGSAVSSHEASQQAKSGGTPAYIQAGDQTAIQKATAISNTPYTPYTGERIAPLSENEQSGVNLAKSAVTNNVAEQNLAKASNQVDQVANNPWNADTASKYMNPYTSAVTNTALRNENKAYTENEQDIASGAAKVGAFGGDRQSVLQGQDLQAHLQSVGDITAKGQSDAYKQAVDTWQADNQRRLAASTAYDQVGGDINKLNSAQIADLMETGGAARTLQQAGADFNYKQFVENRDWSTTQLQPLIQALSVSHGVSGAPVPNTANAAGQIIGLASTLIGYYGNHRPSSSPTPDSSPSVYGGLSPEQASQAMYQGDQAAASYQPDFSGISAPDYSGLNG